MAFQVVFCAFVGAVVVTKRKAKGKFEKSPTQTPVSVSRTIRRKRSRQVGEVVASKSRLSFLNRWKKLLKRERMKTTLKKENSPPSNTNSYCEEENVAYRACGLCRVGILKIKKYKKINGKHF